jgi:hypothetical protein
VFTEKSHASLEENLSDLANCIGLLLFSLRPIFGSLVCCAIRPGTRQPQLVSRGRPISSRDDQIRLDPARRAVKPLANGFPPENTLEIAPQDYKDRDNDERQNDE